MKPQTFIFFGKSGCGKGTQAKLLVDHLKSKDQSNKIIYIETGEKLREFSEEVGISAEMTAKLMNEGRLLPSFLPIWIWSNIFIRHINGAEHLILDGLARRQFEAPVLDDALRFYNRQNPFVIIMNVSDKWAKDHLLMRGRLDDNAIDIDARLAWYRTNVEPTIEYFKKNLYYTILEINGEQTIAEVQQEILTKANLY